MLKVVKDEVLFWGVMLLIDEELGVAVVLNAVELELLFMVLLVGERVLLQLALAIELVLYRFKRFGPPQYSDPSPLQVIEQPLTSATTEPVLIVFPQ